MTLLYFINTDVRNARAHTTQILQTALALSAHLPVRVVAPRYGRLDAAAAQAAHGLSALPPLALLPVGVRTPGALGFLLFTLPALVYLIRAKLRGEASGIYLRSSLLYPLVLCARVLRLPVFYETHRRPLTRGEKWRDALIAVRSAGIITISAYMRTHYEEYRKPLLVAHDAVALERFGSTLPQQEARQQLGLAEGPLCVYTGSVSKLKGAQHILEAARLLPEVQFVLAGGVAPDIAQLPLPRNVLLAGREPQERVPLYLRAADVLLLPHPRGEYSQSPMKLFEYMAAGVPIVASALEATREVLSEQSAVLVEPESGAALAAGIEEVLGDPARAGALAARAREEVQHYTWSARGASIADFVRKLL